MDLTFFFTPNKNFDPKLLLFQKKFILKKIVYRFWGPEFLDLQIKTINSDI